MSELFLKLLNMSLTAGWLILAVVVLRLVLKKAPKWVNCVLWALVAVRLICPFSFESDISLVPEQVGSGELVSEWADDYVDDVWTIPDTSIYYDAAVFNGREPSYAGDGHYYVVAKYDQLGEPATVKDTVVPVLTAIWLAGVAVLLLHALISYLRLRRRVSAAMHAGNKVWLCDAVESPFILGFFRPRIYLPSSINEEDVEHVLAHERAHLQRRDHWWKPIGYVLLSVYWFNPLIWVAYILLCRDIELACDEKVIKRPDTDRKAYSEALLACSVKRSTITACPLAFGEVSVRGRIKSVLNYKKPAFWIMLLAVVACVIVAVCFLTNPKQDQVNVSAPDSITFRAEILEIHDGYYLVEPETSWKINSADRIEVPMQNMASSLEPQVGDVIEIIYSGEILETYPARLHEVFSIRVVTETEEGELSGTGSVEGAGDLSDMGSSEETGVVLTVNCERINGKSFQINGEMAEELLTLLQGLTYDQGTCDGIPEYRVIGPEQQQFDVNLTDGWAWMNKMECKMSEDIAARIYELLLLNVPLDTDELEDKIGYLEEEIADRSVVAAMLIAVETLMEKRLPATISMEGPGLRKHPVMGNVDHIFDAWDSINGRQSCSDILNHTYQVVDSIETSNTLITLEFAVNGVDWGLTFYDGTDTLSVYTGGAEYLLRATPKQEDVFLSPLGSLIRRWYDEAEYMALDGYDGKTIVIPYTGQSYLEAAQAWCEAYEGLHLKASSGSKKCYTYVSCRVEPAEGATSMYREQGEIGENTYGFYVHTAFVPENEQARQWSMAGNTGNYEGNDPNVPKEALEYTHCGYITLEEDGWHGTIVGTGW